MPLGPSLREASRSQAGRHAHSARCSPRAAARAVLGADELGAAHVGDAHLAREHLVDDTVVLGLLGRHEEVAVAVLLNLLYGLAGVVGDVLAEKGADEKGSPWPGSQCPPPGPGRRPGAGGS